MAADTQLKHTPLQHIAQVISDLFSPIMLPAYMMAVSMWMTPLVIVPEKIRFIVMGVVVFLTAILPTAAIITLMKLGKVSDMSLPNRSERLIPYIVSVICYVATFLYLDFVNAPYWLADFYIGAAMTSICALLITFRWKISAHASAIAGFTAAVIWLALHNMILLGATYWTCGAILLCGILGTVRLILNRHTLAQVFAGYLLGAVSVSIALCFRLLF